MLIQKIKELRKEKAICLEQGKIKKAKRIDKAIKDCLKALKSINDIGTTPDYGRDY